MILQLRTKMFITVILPDIEGTLMLDGCPSRFLYVQYYSCVSPWIAIIIIITLLLELKHMSEKARRLSSIFII